MMASARAPSPPATDLIRIPSAAPITKIETPATPPTPSPEPPPAAPVVGKPSEEQMVEYRKRIAVYTKELPASENLGSTQKMRAFITRWFNPPTAPQDLSVAQWDELLAWFEKFMTDNSMKNLVKYINDSLGVK
jgi:hypothetical protein